MKKLLSVCSMALLTIILVIFFVGCSRDESEVTYSLDKSEFNAVVEYNSSFSLDGLNILAQYSETTEVIPVTESMLVGTPDTSSVGTKQITIDFIGRIFVLSYEVKYKVEFVSQGETISTQYVLGIDDLQIPAPTYGDYIFEGWLPQIPSDIIDNSTFTALFADGTSNVTVPTLRTLNATYGDTLGGIELPSNVYGEWRFVGADSDTVGNVGTNALDVEFVLKANGEVYKQDSVSIKVAKRELEFKDMTLSFVYDGEEHFPTYALDADVKVNVIEGKPETEAGNYSFALWIDDKNYSGEYEGSFEITKPKVTITINSYEIVFGESIPDVEYTVTGADESLLGLELVLPEFANLVAGQTYEITAECSNTNFDVTVNPGTLTVNKNVLDLKPVVIGGAIYGNDISTLTFEPAAEGYWTWENESAKIDTPTSFTATAVFVPYSAGYESIRADVTVPVAKRQVSIEIVENTFVYDGKEHTVSFKVMDGDTDITDECEVIGAPSATNATRTESHTLEIVSDKYTGSAGVILTIEKAVPECDFTTVTFTETWRRTLTLGNLNLPEGYSWVNASEAPTVGTHEYDAKFTPKDTANYATVNGKISVTVEKASGAIRGVNNSYTSTYNGEEYVFDGIFGNHTESELVYTYELSGNAVDSIKNAGVYTVTITLPETEHYTSDTQTTTVTIGKRLMDYTVGNKTATYGDTLGSIDISELSTELGAWVWQDGANTRVGDAGTNEFVLNFVPDDPDNYEALSFNVNVTVGKRLLTFAIIQSAFMYDTTEHTVLYKLVNDDVEITGITVDGNIVRTDVCKETVVLSVNDANYYGDTTVTFEIVASDKYIPNPLPDFTATYGDALGSIELPESEDGVWTWNDANLSVGNAGTKKFGVTFTHNNPNYTPYKTEVVVIVSKAVVEVPTLDINSFVYNREVQKPEITVADDALYMLTSNVGGRNVGTYYVALELKDSANYKWSTTTEAVVNIPYEITKAQAEVSDLTIEGWTYLENAKAPTATTTFGTIIYTYYKEDGTLIGTTAPTAAGKYYVKAVVEETANYYGTSDTYSFEIEKLGIATPTFTNNGTKYTGSDIIPEYTLNNNYTVVESDLQGIKNVKSYEVRFTLTEVAKANYRWIDSETDTVVASFTVTKAEAQISEIAISGWIYNGTVVNNPFATTTFGSISYTYYKADGTKLDAAPTDAGTYYVVASVAGTDDYDGASAEKSFTISKATVTVPEITNKQYNGNTLTADISSNEYYTVEENNGGIDKGDYDVVLKLKDTANYKWSDGDDAESKTLKFSIVTAVNSWTTAPSIAGWTYNETASVWAAAAKYGNVTVEYKIAGAADSTYTTTVPTNAGNYVARFTVAATDDYGALSTTVSFEIFKAEVEVPTLGTNSLVYTGELQMPEVTIPDGALYSLNANAGGTTVGTYYVVFELNDSANYKWSANDTATVSVPYEITKASNEITDLTIGGWTYGESANAPSASTAFGTIAYTYSTDRDGTYTANQPINAGTYYVKASVAETANYAGAEAIFEFVIEQQGIATPTFTNNNTSYTGSSIIAQYVESTLYTASGNAVDDNVGVIGAGTYDVVFTLTDTVNYKWHDSETTSVTAKFTVAKAENTITSVTVNGWTYGDEANSPLLVATDKTGAITYTYYKADGTLVGATAPTAVGSYYVVVSIAESDNYLAAAEVKSSDFTVDKASVTVPTLSTNISYNGGVQMPEVTIPDGALYTVSKNEGGTTVGTYYVEFILNDSDNYKWSTTDEATVSVPYTITKGTNSISNFTITEKIPYGTAIQPSASDSFGNTVTFIYSTEANGEYTGTVPSEVGTYYVKATVFGDGVNYDTVTTPAKAFEITKAAIDKPTVEGTLTYTGSDLAPQVNKPGYYTAVITKDGVTVDSVIAVGSYKVVITLTGNCDWKEGGSEPITLNFNVVRADNTIGRVDIKDNANLTYTGNAIVGDDIFTVTAKNTDGEISYTYYDSNKNLLSGAPINAGTYYVVVTIGESDNYNSVTMAEEDMYEFEIAKATPEITVPGSIGTYYENITDIEGVLNSSVSNVTAGSFAFTIPEGPYTSASADGIDVTVTVTFTPQDTANYKELSQVLTVKLHSVAHIGNTYYGSIETALRYATSGSQIFVIPNTSGEIYIRHDCTVPSGVTLVIPVTDGDSKTVTVAGGEYKQQGGLISSAATAHASYQDLSQLTLVNQVNIADGVTVSVNGTLKVMGLISGSNGGGSYAGHTASSYAKIVMEGDSSIKVSGTSAEVYCYGFIMDAADDEESKIEVLNGAKLYQPFVLRDFRGGTYMKTVYQNSNPISPFNQFELPNITSLVKIDSDSYLYTRAGLYAGSLKTYYPSEICMIGNGGVIQLSSGAYITAKYDLSTIAAENRTDPKFVTDCVCYLNIYGDCQTNSMQLTFQGIPLKTNVVHFPLTWRFNITLNSGTCTLNQKFKMLPGHVFTVAEGATLVVKEELVIYDEFNDTTDVGNVAQQYGYGKTLNPAKLIVNGTLKCTGSIGGKIYTEVDGAQVIISKLGATSYESEYIGSLTEVPITYDYVIFCYGSSELSAEGHSVYYSVNGAWRKAVNVSFDTDGGNAVDSVYESDGKYPELPTPTREGYDFIGWSYNGELVSAGDPLKEIAPHTLTAQWKQMYYIEFDSKGGSSVDSVYVSQNNAVYPTLTTPTYIGYDFVGWYYGDTKVTAGEAITAAVGTVTLTARWEKNGVIVSFDSAGGSSVDNISVADGIYPELTIPTRPGYRFDGWYYDGNLVTAGTALSTSDDHTLTAQWTAYKVTYDANGGTCEITDASGAVTLPTPTSGQFKFNGWFDAAEGGNKIGNGGDTYTPTADITLYAQWVSYTITIKTQSGATVTVPSSALAGDTVEITVKFNNSTNSLVVRNATTRDKLLEKNSNGTYTFTMPESDVEVEATSIGGCVTPDTLVTLADGTQKEIQYVTHDDMLLVWNFYEGKYESVPSAIIFDHGYANNTVIELTFSDGTVVKVVNLHQFLDADTNTFVEINAETVASYVGHRFVKHNGSGYVTVELVDYSITEKYEGAYGIISALHYNILVEGMFSTDFMPEDYLLFNYFEIGDGMKYDEEKMQADIEKYGLYTYEEFADYLTYDQFIAFNVQYMKIAVGKGNYTFEGILALIDFYLNAEN